MKKERDEKDIGLSFDCWRGLVQTEIDQATPSSFYYE